MQDSLVLVSGLDSDLWCLSYSNQLPDSTCLMPLALETGSEQDLKLQPGCVACTPTPHNSQAMTGVPTQNLLLGSIPTIATICRVVRCMRWGKSSGTLFSNRKKPQSNLGQGGRMHSVSSAEESSTRSLSNV